VTNLFVLFAVLGQYAEAKADLQIATEFIKNAYAVELQGYDTGDNVHYILELLRPLEPEAISTSGLRSQPEVVSDDIIIPTSGPSPSERYDTLRRHKRNPVRPLLLETVLASYSRSLPETVSGDLTLATSGPPVQLYNALQRRRRSVKPRAIVDNKNGGQDKQEVNIVVLDNEAEADVTYQSLSGWNGTAKAKYAERSTYATRLLEIAHGLHYVGIGILAVFVVQVSHSSLS